MEKKQPIIIQESDKIQVLEVTTEDTLLFDNYELEVNFIKGFPPDSRFTMLNDHRDCLHLIVLDYYKDPKDKTLFIKYSLKSEGKFVIITLKIPEIIEIIKPPIQDTRISTQAIDGILAEISKLKGRLETIEQTNKSFNNKIGVDNVRIVKLEDKLSSTDKDVANLKTAIQRDSKFCTHHLKNNDERLERHNNRLGVIENKLSI